MQQPAPMEEAPLPHRPVAAVRLPLVVVLRLQQERRAAVVVVAAVRRVAAAEKAAEAVAT